MRESQAAELSSQSPLRRRLPPSKSISSTSTSESLGLFSVAASQDLESRFASPNFRYAKDDPAVVDISPTSAEIGGEKRARERLELATEETPECEHLDTEELVTPRTPWVTKPRTCASTRSVIKHSHHLSSLPSPLSSLSFTHRVRHASNDSSLFTLQHILTGHRNTITGAVALDDFLISSSVDYTIRLWDLRTAGVKSRIAPTQTVLAHKGRVVGVTTLKQDRLASIGADTGAIWSFTDQGLDAISRFRIEAGTCLAAPSPLTLLIGFAGGGAAVYSVETAQAIVRYDSGTEVIGKVMCMERGAFVTGTEKGGISTWDFRSPKGVYSVQGHSEAVTSLLEVDESCFLSASKDCCVKVLCTQRNGTLGRVQCSAPCTVTSQCAVCPKCTVAS